ncbi:MAG: hypothetical protein QM706_21575 [Nitrospira sp.]
MTSAEPDWIDDSFGTIWSWAKQRGIPTRPREWRSRHPQTTYGRETEAFVSLYRQDLIASGVPMDHWAVEQIEMRLGYPGVLPTIAHRETDIGGTRRRVEAVDATGDAVLLLPERLAKAKAWVRQLAEILVACERSR